MKSLVTVFAATGNQHKLDEFCSILGVKGISVVSVYDVIPTLPIPEESGKTLEENAILKVKPAYATIHRSVFADDSGLEVTALQGEPGIYSSRYAGDDATSKDNVEKLLHRLRHHDDRSARFVCIIAVASLDGNITTVRGEIEGSITLSPRGDTGFGYDPVFIPKGHDRTFSQMESEEKDAISHRTEALRKACSLGLFS